jgi:hypothetical protein
MEHNDELNPYPTLNKMSRKEVYNAPEGYFAQLSSGIQDRISKNEVVAIPRFKLQPLAILASLVIVLLVSGTVFYLSTKSEHKQELAVTYDDVIESGYYTEIDEDVLCDNVPQKTATASTTISDTLIDEYLINNADETQISNSF